MLPKIDSISETASFYIPKIKTNSFIVYWLMVTGVIISLALLPFLYTDIAVRSTGIIRPLSERTEIKSVISGIIDSLYRKEGDTIVKDAVLLTLKDLSTKSKTMLNAFEITQREQFISDLQLLSLNNFYNTDADFQTIIDRLKTPLYKEQTTRFLHQKAEQDILLKKAVKELEMNTSLAKDKVISPKEFFDIQIQEQRQRSAGKALIQEQLSNWQQDLAKYRLELSQYRQETNQITTDASYYEIKSPVDGVIQGINGRYSGDFLQTNEIICEISPLGSLIAECYVPAANIGLIKSHQEVRFQIEAFDYNYFGIVTGRVTSIENDFSVVDNKPVFKVRCLFDTKQVYLKNGYAGELKKGLTFQCRFIVAKRSLWQLLWDNVNDWLNPTSPIKTAA